MSNNKRIVGTNRSAVFLILILHMKLFKMAKTKQTLCVEHTEDKIKQDHELSSDNEDETVNEGNGNLVESSEVEDVIQKRLDPSVESAIREATSNIFELNEGNSISIGVSSDSSSLVPNVVSDVHDNSLESYLIGEMSKGMGDD